MRLDQRLRAIHPTMSWARIRRAIAAGQVLVDGSIERDAGCEVSADTSVEFDPNRRAQPVAHLELPRLHEDEQILVVNKPAGLLTIASHPLRKDSEDTVLGRVREYVRYRDGRSGYAGVLHRLDRDTSGALALALTREAHRAGRELFAAHRFERRYLAIVQGVPSRQTGVIDAPISSVYRGGRRGVAPAGAPSLPARTHYVVREQFERAALVELTLETGRQHQIRAHLEHVSHPLLGERVYARRDERPLTINVARPMLHAWRLAFPHPVRGGRIRVEAPIPGDFDKLLAQLRRQSRV